MTASAEARARLRAADRPCGPIWRENAARRQQAAIEPGRSTVSCSARRGSGGLGRHVAEIAAAVERAGGTLRSISGEDRAAADAPASGEQPSSSSSSSSSSLAARARLAGPRVLRTLGAAHVPVSPGVRTRVFMAAFDTWAAGRIGAGENLIAFNGQALEQLRAAERASYSTRVLVSANSHMRLLRRQHARALHDYPLERSWSERLVARNLAEYAEADRIYVSSRYVRESFLAEGFDEQRLVDFPLTPDPRFVPLARERAATGFEILYVGSLAVHKGVPLLIDAVRRLGHRDLSLTLLGGWATRGMRRFVQSACVADPRIRAEPGDPLAHLRRASVCVHPAYEDGFAYAPAEALACGVPVIVSEDTGMKELIDGPDAGLVLPTGDLDALTEAIDAAYRGEILDA